MLWKLWFIVENLKEKNEGIPQVPIISYKATFLPWGTVKNYHILPECFAMKLLSSFQTIIVYFNVRESLDFYPKIESVT